MPKKGYKQPEEQKRERIKKIKSSWNNLSLKRQVSERMIGNTFGFKKGQKPVNGFKKGCTPICPFKKGNHPNSEFKVGHNAWNKIDGLSGKRKYKLKKGKPVSHIIWSYDNNVARIPDGCLIHHINQNPLDNNSKNLQLMTIDFHNKLHSKFFKEGF